MNTSNTDVLCGLISQINDIVSNFNFDRVEIAMVALNWKWAICNFRRPTKLELIETATNLLFKCLSEWANREYPREGMVCATGGFSARVECFVNSPTKLTLSFNI